MTDSPLDNTDGPIMIFVKSRGSDVSDMNISGITVTSAVNGIPGAHILIEDGTSNDNGNGNGFPVSDSKAFEPGAEIDIDVGYGGDGGKRIFSGVVVRHALQVSAEHGSRLAIECQDIAFAMTLERKSRTHLNKKDSDIISGILGNYDIKKASVVDTAVNHREQVQYSCPDWDYVLRRAKANGMVVTVDGGEVKVASPGVAGEAKLKVTFGQDLINFEANIDGRTQVQTEALREWANSMPLRAGLVIIQGTASFQGSAKARINSLIELSGVGDRFSGHVYVNQVEHEIHDGEWITHITFGLKPEWIVENNDIVSFSAGRFPEGVGGLHIGKVIELGGDPRLQHRVKVAVPELGEEAEPVWARLSTFYASNGAGGFFAPEIDDEVVLGFMNDVPSQPVIIGSLYSSTRAPAVPYQLEDENNLKALVTRSQLKIEFDDDKRTLTLQTPAGNTVILNDENESISISDQNSNSMILDRDGISLDTPKDFSITAKGNVTIDASGDVNVSAKSDVNVEGSNITHTAKIGFTAKGDASAELSASGQTTVKGAMVMIN